MLGTYIRRLRKGKNITLSQLAKKTNISKSYLSNIERNIQTNPTIGILVKLAIALDADIQSLINANNHSSYLKTKRYESLEINHELLEKVKIVIESGRRKVEKSE
ncbi:helix-turn-helix domain-containing protein [Peribacillus sp. SCS-155]|uniref:helix-turn-helix domain-containing protein n=1 Tax=Peribacillus sedimenti TaxID=3115297 RepID=UPI003905E126